MKTTRPLELIYLSVFVAPTEEDGDLYVFFALDDYSQFFFQLEVENESNELTIVNNIIKFTQHQDFVKQFNNKPFTLVIPFELDTQAESLVNDVLKLFNARVSYNQELVFDKVKPILNTIFKITQPS